MQRRHVQTKVYYKLCYSVWKKKTPHKPLKLAAAKKSFPTVHIIDTTCFDEWFLFRVITGRHCFLYKFIVIQRFGETAMMLCSLKEVRILNPSSPKYHYNVACSVQMSTTKVSTSYICWQRFYSFSQWMFHIFLYKWNF